MTEKEFGKLWNYVLRNIVLCVVCFAYALFVLYLLVNGFYYIPFEKMPWGDVFFDLFQGFCAYRVLVYGINQTADMLGHKK
ncbi:MAG: hypothetical protein HYT27_02090 [Parcubacteria group bacterium]|nr:hypothetical protein [Parcubacteria group bacterium]